MEKTVTSISIPSTILKMAKEKAFSLNISFSEYIHSILLITLAKDEPLIDLDKEDLNEMLAFFDFFPNEVYSFGAYVKNTANLILALKRKLKSGYKIKDIIIENKIVIFKIKEGEISIPFKEINKENIVDELIVIYKKCVKKQNQCIKKADDDKFKKYMEIL